MGAVIQIKGRDAIPVRALPWLTDWWFGAQEVAEALGQRDTTFFGYYPKVAQMFVIKRSAHNSWFLGLIVPNHLLFKK